MVSNYIIFFISYFLIVLSALGHGILAIRLSKTKYRVLIGPFNDIKSLKNSFEKMNYFNFENLEILNNV